MIPSEAMRTSWFAPSTEERLSLTAFHDSMRPYLASMSDMQWALQEAREPFEAGDVLPFQCRGAISTLIDFNKQMRKYCHLLRGTSTLPMIMMALRYRLLDELHYLEEMADKLINRISSYCSICMTSSPIALRQERVIDKLFETLLRHAIDLPQKAVFMMQEARFQEERLTSIT